jgi:hypothetical protein
MLQPMTTVVTTPTERPVFVALDDRRARRLRYAAAAAVVIACTWVAALVVGMLGFSGLPSVSLPLVAHDADAAPSEPIGLARATTPAVAKAESISAAKAAAQRRTTTAPRSGVVARTSSRPVAATTAAARRTSPPARAQRRAVPPQTVAPAAPAPPATTARQGWARRGATAPPGQTRAAEQTVREKNLRQPAVPPGQTRRPSGREATTAPVTPVTTPVPPGQLKKADEPTQNA